MNFFTPRKAHVAMAITVAATSALVIVGPGSATATAGRLLGSAGIRNNSIRSIDIHNNTITGKDVRDGSLSAKDFSGKLRGATGPRGPAGPAGSTGPRGLQGPPGTGAAGGNETTVRSWTAHSDGTSPNTLSSNLPSATQVQIVKLATPVGDFSACDQGASITITMGGNQQLAVEYFSQGSWHLTPFSSGAITAEPTPLTLSAECDTAGSSVPGPAFDVTVTVAQTALDTTPTSTLN